MTRRRFALFWSAASWPRWSPSFPPLTCTAQSTYLTGKLPRDHGAVANGWYDREYDEHRFWKQSNHLVSGEKLWESLRRIDPQFTCAKLFWWYNMHSSADFAITPRPPYPADGRKVFDVHTQPMGMRERVRKDLGPFPFPSFSGPAADIKSTLWIAQSAKWVEEKHWPSLSLVYLPASGLRSPAPRLGHARHPARLEGHRRCRRRPHRFYGAAERSGSSCSPNTASPTSIVRAPEPRLPREGWISIEDELGRESIDLGGSEVFAIADHQVAHVYVQDSTLMHEVRALLQATPASARSVAKQEKFFNGLEHSRSGDLIAGAADARSWFTYSTGSTTKKRPTTPAAWTFTASAATIPWSCPSMPAIKFPKLKVGLKLARKLFGFRMLMDVIPLDAMLVRGSHGRVPEDTQDWPVLIGDLPHIPRSGMIRAHEVFNHLHEHCSRGARLRLGEPLGQRTVALPYFLTRYQQPSRDQAQAADRRDHPDHLMPVTDNT